MGSTIIQILTIVGSLGLFLFGMKLMSESLQKVAGNKLRDILASMTSTTFKRILVGLFVTTVIQSSSATTVMIISFVNAGLLSLVQAIGMIMGANIGTTATAWLISLGAFKIDLSLAAIPLIAFGAPMLFMKGARTKSIGELIIGFSVLFMGLGLLKDSMSGLQENPAALEFLSHFSNKGYWSVLFFVFVGTVLTIVVQSSSATMALTIIMCNNGWIPFDFSCAMVLGENVGTTITANLAAMVANTEAKRAALAHLVFNLIGVVWMLIAFRLFLWMIVAIVEFFGSDSPITDPHARPVALSLFHTLFNIFNTCLLVGFTSQIAQLVTQLIPAKEEPKNRLTYIEGGMLSTTGLTIIQARNELVAYSTRSSKMFGFVRSLFRETDPQEFDATYQRIEKYETISDNLETEIYNYLNKATQDEVGGDVVGQTQIMMKVISDIETMSDSNYKLAQILKYKRDNNIWFNQDMRDKINAMFDLIDRAIMVMNTNVSNAFEPNYTIPEDVYLIESQINAMEDYLKGRYIFEIEDQKLKRSALVVFAELISEAERVADSVKQVSKDILNVAPHTKPQLSHV
jgi:phosphate:Na+ symporter